MSNEQRIENHPILNIGRQGQIPFYWNGNKLTAKSGEVISSALFAAGIKIFGHHHRDKGPMGIFCANGQCSQCTVIADGIPVKACVTEVRSEMQVKPCNGIPVLSGPGSDSEVHNFMFGSVPVIKTQVAIIGGGPSGLAAAIELSKHGIKSILIDDKANLGGKLVLQTHTFFGSVDDCYAGTRGIDIAIKLENEARASTNITLMPSAQAVAIFADNRIGVVRTQGNSEKYLLIEPNALLVATGAREKALSFPGCDLPGVYGAGAFQTLVNRDLVKAGERIFIVGAGNVGLIAGYHGLQAGMTVPAVIEALPKVSGYKVHKDKLARLGVPILLSHTILSANSNSDKSGVESVTIAKVDSSFKPIAGTEKTIGCDTVLIAAGLSSCDEFYKQAQAFGLKVFIAGDAEEIAEASAAIFSGKIAAVKIVKALGSEVEIPEEYSQKMEVLKSKPGQATKRKVTNTADFSVYPVFHCYEEIPCNPCTSACSKELIQLRGQSGTIMDLPFFEPKGTAPSEVCSGCLKCTAVCPGLAITIVDKRKAPEGKRFVYVPFEMKPNFAIGDRVAALGAEGEAIGEVEVIDIINKKWQDKTLLVKILTNKDQAELIAGIGFQKIETFDQSGRSGYDAVALLKEKNSNIVCRCEKVTDGEIRNMIRSGVTDMNALKILRCTMGACGGKTCATLIRRIFIEEKVDLNRVTENVLRPLNAEVRLGTFANAESKRQPHCEESYESNF